jgi:hypothetical protein
MLRSICLAVAAFACPGIAWGQQQAVSSDEIVVIGERSEESLRTFARQISQATGPEGQLSRWDRTVCIGVGGVRPRYAQQVIDRIAARALDVGLSVGGPGCAANSLVLFSNNADAAAEELVSGNRAALGYFSSAGESTAGRDALREFVTSDSPVRWWYVSHTHSRSGARLSGQGSGQVANNFIVGGATRLRQMTRQDIAIAVAIVDAQLVGGTSLNVIADYLAMVLLAQINPDADVAGAHSILNLFEQTGGRAPEAMTDWDLAYLRGLYQASREAASAAVQHYEIGQTMASELAEPSYEQERQ